MAIILKCLAAWWKWCEWRKKIIYRNRMESLGTLQKEWMHKRSWELIKDIQRNGDESDKSKEYATLFTLFIAKWWKKHNSTNTHGNEKWLHIIYLMFSANAKISARWRDGKGMRGAHISSVKCLLKINENLCYAFEHGWAVVIRKEIVNYRWCHAYYLTKRFFTSHNIFHWSPLL